ncbi:MAG: hypothetical protein H7837_08470 [Magnetococcus sp. MYC-9]
MNHSAEEPAGGIDCRRCCHFQITWDPEFPRGCRAMGFKSSQWPWMEVLRSSGEPCLKFEAKPRPQPERSRRADENGSTQSGFSRVV